MTFDPAAIQAKFQQGFARHQKGQAAEARRIYDEVLAHAPQHFDALHFAGVLAAQTGAFARAVELISRALSVNPEHAAAYYNLGMALGGMEQHPAALDAYDKAIALKPDYIEARFRRGNTLRALGRFDEALAAYDAIIAANAGPADVYNERGLVLLAMGQHQDALTSFGEAVRLRPSYAEACANSGVVLRALGQLQAAVDAYDRAIALKPDHAGFYNNRGAALADLRRFEDALASYDRAIALNPEFAEACNNRAVALTAIGRHEDALAIYRRAIQIDPGLPDAHNNLANTLLELKRHEDAVTSYDRVLALDPGYAYVYGTRLHARMFTCQWNRHEEELEVLVAKIARGEKASSPFPVVTLVGKAALQRKAAEVWARDKYPANSALGPVVMRAFRRGEKIRVAYFSADFRDHPVSLLMAGLIEEHDRERFEVYGFSFGPDTGDGMRKRLEKSFDKFFDVRDMSDRDIAILARTHGIDIAVDLGGYTRGTRTNIFALRAAPIQVNYLGYAGTMGAGYIDYIIADQTVIPAEARTHYAEKVVWMPGSYQVNGTRRPVADRAPSRRAQGLPDTGVVFCCFNNNYKITPAIFDVWVRILKGVENSVLWLSQDNDAAAENLRKEAKHRGLDPSRIVFSRRTTGFADHLARHELADLFLDTLPFNAHTTGSDALWAGLPMLTCIGESYAGRVAASLLKAVGLPELITTSRQGYCDLAIELGNDPHRLTDLKDKLARSRYTASLFDVAGFARHVESAYRQMHDRYRGGQSPDHIVVAP